MIDIEKSVNKGAWKLINVGDHDNKLLETVIVDVELDGFKGVFNNDGCIEIHYGGNGWITLDERALKKLIKLINKAEKTYTNE